MIFDFTINLGNILTLLAFLVGGIAFVWSVKSNAIVLSTKIDLNEETNESRFVRIDAQMEAFGLELKKLGEILIELTRAEGRMNTLDERILSQGRRLDALTINVNDLLKETRSAVHRDR
jgi:hypothetical protein